MNQDLKLVIDGLNSIESTIDNYKDVESAVTLLETLSNKVIKQEKQIQQLQMALADTEALEAGTSERYMTLKKQVSDSQEVITEQAAVIEGLREVINSLLGPMSGFDPDNKPSTFACHHHSETCSNCAVLVGNWKVKCKAIQILLITKTDSKKILSEWMREQLGDPEIYRYMHTDLGIWKEVEPRNINVNTVMDTVNEIQTYIDDGYKYVLQPLYKLPECLR